MKIRCMQVRTNLEEAKIPRTEQPQLYLSMHIAQNQLQLGQTATVKAAVEEAKETLASLNDVSSDAAPADICVCFCVAEFCGICSGPACLVALAQPQHQLERCPARSRVLLHFAEAAQPRPHSDRRPAPRLSYLRTARSSQFQRRQSKEREHSR